MTRQYKIDNVVFKPGVLTTQTAAPSVPQHGKRFIEFFKLAAQRLNIPYSDVCCQTEQIELWVVRYNNNEAYLEVFNPTEGEWEQLVGGETEDVELTEGTLSFVNGLFTGYTPA